jgi:hypothetical protein
VPREGTKIREVYDLFQANKGLPIAFTIAKHQGRIPNLVDYYGLDIRCIRDGTWVLAGEWFGRVYVDYVIQHLNSARAA